MQGQGWAAQHAAGAPRSGFAGPPVGGSPSGGGFTGTPVPQPTTPTPSGGIGQGGPWGGTPNLGAPGTVETPVGPGPAPAWGGYAGGIVGVGRGIPR